MDPSQPFDKNILRDYDICVTGAAMKQYEHQPTFIDIIQHTWVYARVSPPQKEYILSTMKALGYITLMAGDGTNDVGALKQAHVGIALLNGSEDDLKKIAEHQKNERLKKVYEQQCKISARFNQPPPPVPPALKAAFPELVETQQQALASMTNARKKNPMEKVSLFYDCSRRNFVLNLLSLQQFDLASITDKMAEMDDENEPPKIKLGDASCAAPFTSKLANVSAGKYDMSYSSRLFGSYRMLRDTVTSIIRQGRCTLVATTQMFLILGLNALITAYSLSVQYLDGIKFGDYQVTITGILMSVCFYCISRAKVSSILSLDGKPAVPY